MTDTQRRERNERRLVETYPTFAERLRATIVHLERQGLTTGIRWGLPPALRKAIDDAIAAKAWSAAVKIGWDPAHVETRGVTTREARAGMRPI